MGHADTVGRRLPVLIVDDDPALAKHAKRPFEDVWPVIITGSLRAAGEAMRDAERLAAALLDMKLPDGRGAELIDPLLERQPHLRILVMTGYTMSDLPGAMQRLGVEFVGKPFEMECLTAFARRVALSEHISDERACRHIATVAGRAGLTVRETETVALAVCGLKEGRIAERLGIKESTVNTHGRHAAEKLEAKNLTQAAWNILAKLREGLAAPILISEGPLDLAPADFSRRKPLSASQWQGYPEFLLVGWHARAPARRGSNVRGLHRAGTSRASLASCSLGSAHPFITVRAGMCDRPKRCDCFSSCGRTPCRLRVSSEKPQRSVSRSELLRPCPS